MPLFDFHCNACDKRFEAIVPSSETSTECRECGASTTERLFTKMNMFSVIQATSKTSKRFKAGYVHKYQNRPAEKISVQVPASKGT